MLHRLSNTLGELYGIADEAPVADCIDAFFLAMRKLVPFDGAAMGDASGPPPYGLVSPAAHTFGLDSATLAAFDRGGKVAERFHASGMQAISVDSPRAGSAAGARDVAHLLLSGTPASTTHPACWIVLARYGDPAFSESDLAFLKTAWPHLVRCLHLLRRRVIAALAHAHGPGVALLSPDGAIAAADPCFESLCLAEWQAGAPTVLPEHVATTLMKSGEFDGRTVRLRAFRQDGFAACCATARTACDLLTRAERVVAFRYASGESHKEIAIGLSVSDNTVRTHLAHVYDKLGIHRKADLIRQIHLLH